jgi:tripartite-type tricarboxylate transporter receptor subunit TctC
MNSMHATRRAMGRRRLLAAGAALPLAAGKAAAQGYPSRPVTIIVAYPPGGATDVVGRLVAERLRDRLGQPVVVDNRPAGGATIGMAAAARAAPDGHTLVIGNGHTLSINPFLFADPGYVATRDFTPISLVCTTQNLVVVHPSVPVASLAELIAYAKARPGQLNYASTGSGSPGHLAAELFKSMAGIDMVHVPYRGAAPVLADMLSGRVQVYFAVPTSVTGVIRDGRLRALAVTGARRSALFAELPTVQEAGLPGFVVESWYGLLGPAGLPPEVLSRLHRDTLAILQDPELRSRLAAGGLEPASSTPQEFAELIRTELDRWGPVVRASGAKVE